MAVTPPPVARSRDAAALEPHDPVGPRGELGSVRDQQERAPDPEPLDRVGDERRAQRVEVGGRLVEEHERRVAQERARERDPPALARRQLPPPLPDLGLVADGEAGRRTRALPRASPPPARPRSPAVGSPRRMLSATVPRKRVGRWGTQAMRLRHAAASQRRRGRASRPGRAPGRARRGAGAETRACSSRCRSGRPARPSRRARARGRRCEHVHVAGGVGEGDGLEP